jgi:hypothetical protein
VTRLFRVLPLRHGFAAPPPPGGGGIFTFHELNVDPA